MHILMIHTSGGHSQGHMSVLTWAAYVCADLGVQCVSIVCICQLAARGTKERA
jgi:glyoxylase-like metal-dependent hydrolase (beta-lactamase superfamily II)